MRATFFVLAYLALGWLTVFAISRLPLENSVSNEMVHDGLLMGFILWPLMILVTVIDVLAEPAFQFGECISPLPKPTRKSKAAVAPPDPFLEAARREVEVIAPEEAA